MSPYRYRPGEFDKSVAHEMVTEVLPAQQLAIEDAAARVARKSLDRQSLFIEDNAAQALIYELIEFLTQEDVSDDLRRSIVHPRQLTQGHFSDYYDLPVPDEQ